MDNFKVELENKSESNNFRVDLIYKPSEENEIDFSFGNSSKSIERNDLEFLDSEFNLIKPVGQTIVNPIKREKMKMKISKEKPFVYIIKGEVNYHQLKVHVKLTSAEYLLEKGKNYYLQLRYKGKVSEKIQIEF